MEEEKRQEAIWDNGLEALAEIETRYALYKMRKQRSRAHASAGVAVTKTAALARARKALEHWRAALFDVEKSIIYRNSDVLREQPIANDSKDMRSQRQMLQELHDAQQKAAKVEPEYVFALFDNEEAVDYATKQAELAHELNILWDEAEAEDEQVLLRFEREEVSLRSK